MQAYKFFSLRSLEFDNTIYNSTSKFNACMDLTIQFTILLFYPDIVRLEYIEMSKCTVELAKWIELGNC